MRPYSFMLCCLSITGFSSCNTGKSDAGTASPEEGKTRKPNVVIMLTDDQGYFDMHCYGNQNMVTPNLDRLASEGIRMTNYYSGAPSSTPSDTENTCSRHGPAIRWSTQRASLPCFSNGERPDRQETYRKPTRTAYGCRFQRYR